MGERLGEGRRHSVLRDAGKMNLSSTVTIALGMSNLLLKDKETLL